MKVKNRFISLKAKIMLSTLVPVIVSFALISIIIFLSLFASLRETAQAEFLQISENYSHQFETKLNDAMNYLSLLSSDLEAQLDTSTVDRETLQRRLLKVFNDYRLIDGSSVYFEPDMYDGRDADYIGTDLGTLHSGRIAWYFYTDDGKTAYLPEGLNNDVEFTLPHYTEAKNLNKPIYTDPVSYEIDGRHIPMFTLTYPINNASGLFIGAVTVDLFLDDIYGLLQNEQIYETGYIIIANDNEQVIYSPYYEDIGRTREQAGLYYPLPSGGEESSFFNATSKINGKETLLTINSVYIPQLDSSFFISVAAPLSEINKEGTRLMAFLVALDFFVVAVIAVIIYFLIRKMSAPLNEITESVDKIAGGEYGARIAGAYKGEFAVVKDSVNKMADSIEAYINESESSLNILKNILNGLDAYLYVSDPVSCELLFINDNMKKHFHIENDGVGQICWQVFQSGFDAKCEFCPDYQLTSDHDKPVIWEEHNTLTNHYYRNTDRYIDWIGGMKAHLQHSVDITDIKQAQFALDRRLKQQALMTAISQIFLSKGDIYSQITDALRQTGEFIDVVQILFYKLEDDGLTFTCLCEYINQRTGKESGVGIQQTITPALITYMKTLSKDKICCLNSNDPALKAEMDPYMVNFENYISVPIFVKGELFGALDIFREESDREWSESDVNLMTLVSSTLSGVFERSAMEGQLRRLSSIVESSPQFIICVTTDGDIDYVNPAASEITGYTEAELMEGGLDILFDAQTTLEIKKNYIPETLRNGTGSSEINLTHKDGRKRIMAFSSFTTGPDATNIGAIASDVTEIRKLEAELIAARDLAEQGSRSKSEFLSRMSHEMRTPMNAVIGMTNIARSSNDQEQKEYCLERIGNASRHLLGVINDILDMSKIEANKFDLSCSEFNFERMLKRVVDVVSFKIDERRQTFSLHIDPSIPASLIGDEQRLAQVITNLLSNAVKFTPDEGRIGLTVNMIRDENETILLRAEVADSGIGISSEQQAKLFKLFEQADGSIARKFGGTGLGLAISKRIVELMGGEIWVESELGKGSAFIFTFAAKRGNEESPLAVDISNLPEAIANFPETPEAPPSQTYEGKTALLAEDVELNREIVLTVLADTMLQIECAEDGRQAIEMFKANPKKYDIIFMDLHMPEIDGLEAARKIRALDAPEGAIVPIVAMTANVFQEDIEKCMNAGMNGHIGKPIDFDELFAILDKYLK